MTVVVYDRRQGLLSMRGHAGAGEKGSDLVCAALSMLLYTFAAIPGARLRGGEGWAVAKLPPRRADEGGAVCAGFRLLAEAYPRNVKYREVNP